MFALAAVHFNYNKDEFFQLTPAEFSVLLREKKKDVDERFEFIRTELRTVNYFQTLTSMNEINGIKQPSDLYSLPSDQQLSSSHEEHYKSLLNVDKNLVEWAFNEVSKN